MSIVKVKFIIASITSLLVLTSAYAQPNLYRYKDDSSGLYGYKNSYDRIKIKARFKHAKPFSKHGIADVQMGKRDWYRISTQGKLIEKAFYFDNGADYYSQGLTRFVENGKVGFSNKKGEHVIPAQFDFATPFKKGFAKFCNGCAQKIDGDHSTIVGGTWGKIDLQGKMIDDSEKEKPKSEKPSQTQ